MDNIRRNFLIAAVLSLGLLGFNSLRGGGIQGKVTPVDGATQIIAISGRDTLKTDLVNGSFTFTNIKKGTYTIWVKAKAPYQDSSIENVAVIDSAVTDVGEIKLQ